MILETHGDTCRLGYLRLIACLLEDEEPRSFDFLASVLFDMVKNAEDEETLGFKPIGMITRPVNARNYVTLAAEMGVIDRSSQRLGGFGRTYLTMRSSQPFREFVEGRSLLSAKDFIVLSDAERFFFLWMIMVADYPFIQPIVVWAVEKERFTRKDAMNYIMEEVYPQALKKALPSLPARRRAQVEKEVMDAERFREKREATASKTDWIKSSQYAKYRHIAPPRLEWLVDVGVLVRNGRGKYMVDDQLTQNAEKVIKAMKTSLHRMEERLFEEFPPILYRSLRQAGRYEVSKAIVEAYERIGGPGRGPISLAYLEKVAVLLLLEEGMFAGLRTVHDVFNSLALRFPDKIYVAPGSGRSVDVARMDLTEAEI